MRIRAALHGRSMEEEAREILRGALAKEAVQAVNLAQAIRRHMEPVGGVDLPKPSRQPVRRPPKFGK